MPIIPDGSSSVLARVISEDLELRDRLRRVLTISLDEIERMMRYGTPDAKLRVVSNSIAPLLKNLGNGASDDSTAALRMELAAFHADLIAYVTPDEDDPELADVDTARTKPRGPVIVTQPTPQGTPGLGPREQVLNVTEVPALVTGDLAAGLVTRNTPRKAVGGTR